MVAYPNAKVILTVRNPETWYTSVRDSILAVTEMSRTIPMSWFMALKGQTHVIDTAIKVCEAPPKGFKKGEFY